MNFTFLKSGEVAFFRSDAEQADWTQEEMNLVCTFPFDQKKIIEHGMTVLFQDPATNDWQAYEIKNCSTFHGESYQQFTAEDIAISELTDCHIQDEIELTDVTAQTALAGILSGTGWNVGTNTASGTSTGNIGRGAVWEGVTTIRKNWNVNILTRVTVDGTGITGRFIDILNPNGTWRGLRLSIDKNCSDPCVTYDDSELYTALYAYGASYTEGSTIETQHTVETSIAGVVWSKTSEHPAKPAGQKYLEWPEKTALYGRNGRPRFGYFQNTEIKDPNMLILKTWETLKICSEPKISITGTVADLRRMGYADEPLRLYDQAIVEIGDFQYYKQIIRLTVNLLDQTGNTPTIGEYIPNIIYINRETEEYATGGSTGVGGRGGGGGSRSKKQQGEFETSILQNERNILLEARQVNENRDILRQAGMQIDPITGVLIYAEDTENMVGSKFRVQSNRITAEVEQRVAGFATLSSRITQNANSIELETSARIGSVNLLSGRITVEAGRINQIVSAVGSNGEVTAASICLAINREGSSATINADKIYLLGQTIANTITADYITTKLASANMVTAQALLVQGVITCRDGISCVAIYANNNNITNPLMNASVANNTLTLTKADGTEITFSKAATLSGAWSGGTFTVSATGATLSTQIVQGTTSWNGDTATVPVEAIDSDNPGYQYATGRNISVNASSRYDAGWNACRTAMLNSAERLSYYTGTVTTKYDAPSGGATARQVIYPYASHSTTLYTVPDRR